MIALEQMEQGTTEWIQARLGVLTASTADKLVTKTLRPSAQRESVINTLVAERLLQEPLDDWQGNYWTDRGKLLEAEAKAYFELETGLNVSPVGFVYRDEARNEGCSPDGLIRNDNDEIIAGLELKCPKAETHVQYLRDEKADKYLPQVQFSLWATGLPAWYFVAYYPGLPPLLRRFEPDPKWQAAIADAAKEVIDEVVIWTARLEA